LRLGHYLVLSMRRKAFIGVFGPLLAVSALLLGLNDCGGADTIPPGIIQHVIVIVQENRTPDNLFHDPVLIARGADIASSGVNSLGQTIPLTAAPLGIDYDLDHSHRAFVAMYAGGKMNGADQVIVICSMGTVHCPPPNAQFVYVQASDVAPYYQMAEQ
jgi:hypothetical protein